MIFKKNDKIQKLKIAQLFNFLVCVTIPRVTLTAAIAAPVIALTADGLTQATLSFQQFRDADQFGDLGTVRILKSSDQSVLATFDPDLGIIDDEWTEFTTPLPANAIGEEIIVEFGFTSDSSDDDFSGWSIDNVEIAVE